MKRKEHIFKYSEYESSSDISPEHKALIDEARYISEKAYSPYSLFNVGASIRLSNGKIITGNNQENMAYPSGLCAERVALFYAKSQYPDIAVTDIAIVAHSSKFELDNPISPCGACRQALLEYEVNQNKAIKIVLSDYKEEKILVIDSVRDLLPLGFNESNLKNE